MKKAPLIFIAVVLIVFELVRGGVYEMTMTAIGVGLGLVLFSWFQKKGWINTRQQRTPQR